MVLVDVYIPSVDEIFDFMLDENIEVEKIILEIFEIITKKMQIGSDQDIDNFMLYHMDLGRALEKGRTLASSGVKNGSRLMLI